MSKQPYIPLYIGDWEQDTNCISCQAEGAWLKIVFKMFKGDKSGVFKISTKALQNLWKCSPVIVAEIAAELRDNDVCILEVDKEGIFYTFKNRRMMREAKISKERSKAVQKRYKKEGNPPSNNLHPPEYDNDSETGEFKEEGMGETIKGDSFNFDTTLPDATLEAAERNQFTHTKQKNTQFIRDMWDTFILERAGDPAGERSRYTSLSELTKYFLNWIRNKFPKNGTNQTSVTGSNGQSTGRNIDKYKEWINR